MTDLTEKTSTRPETDVGPYSREELQAKIDKSRASGISPRNLDQILKEARQRAENRAATHGR